MNIRIAYVLVRPLQQLGRQFTPEQLAFYNGQGGRPAYVAVNGAVYNMTGSTTWRGGNHFGLTAGRELTADYNTCHQRNPVNFSRFPRVGEMVSQAS